MKNLTNKACIILFVVCLVVAMALSAAMSYSSGTAMTVLGFAVILVGAFCSDILAKLIRSLDSAKS